MESKDLIKDIRDACDGLGPHCSLVTTASVRLLPLQLNQNVNITTELSQPDTSKPSII
jgi:hypothetical protein